MTSIARRSPSEHHRLRPPMGAAYRGIQLQPLDDLDAPPVEFGYRLLPFDYPASPDRILDPGIIRKERDYHLCITLIEPIEILLQSVLHFRLRLHRRSEERRVGNECRCRLRGDTI